MDYVEVKQSGEERWENKGRVRKVRVRAQQENMAEGLLSYALWPLT